MRKSCQVGHFKRQKVECSGTSTWQRLNLTQEDRESLRSSSATQGVCSQPWLHDTSFQKQKSRMKLGMGVKACNPRIWGAEEKEELWVCDSKPARNLYVERSYLLKKKQINKISE